MRIAQLRQYDIANGEGIRTTLFVSGCHFHCKGCFNLQYQNFNFGDLLTSNEINRIVEYVSNLNVSGFSILGGEPLDQKLDELEHLLKTIQGKTGKNIWMWTGYVYEELSSRQKQVVDNYVDVLVDGQFVEELKDMRLKFRGSSNQRILQINTNQNERNILYT